MKALCLIPAFVIVLASQVWATTYFVGKSGSDANSCATAQSSTAGNRKLTIVGGIGCLAAGDTLLIGDGTYVEGDYSVTATYASTSWGAATTIRAENLPATVTGTHNAVWKPSSSNRNALLISFTTRKYIIFQGIKFDCTDADGGAERECIKFDGNDPAGQGFPNHIRFTYCEITGSGVTAIGIYSSGGAQVSEQGGSHEFTYNWVHHNGNSYFNNAHYIQESDNYFAYNVVEDNGSSAFTVSPQNASNPQRNLIEKNIMRRNGTNATNHFGACVEIVGGGNRLTTARNNLCYNNQASQGAFDLHESGPGANEIYHNTIYNNTADGIYITGTANIVKNNIVYGNGGTAIIDSGTSTVLATNTTANPTFVADAPTYDLHLQSGSAAKGAGTSLSGTVTDDYDGVSRPQDGDWDNGAFEYISSTVTDSSQPLKRGRFVPGFGGRK